MKKVKYFLILFLLLILTGCSGSYDITIEDNKSITEKVVFNIDKNEDTYNKAVNLFEENGISRDDYDVTETDNLVKISYTKTYFNIDDFMLNSKIYKELFTNTKYTITDGILSVSSNSKLLLDSSINSDNIINNYNVDYLSFNMKTNNEVISNNAEEVNDNIYTWTFDNETTNKTISFSINTDNNTKNRLYIIVIGMIALIIIGSLTIIGRNYIKRQKMN